MYGKTAINQHFDNIPFTAKCLGETFMVFTAFSLNRKYFAMNYGLVDWQYKFISMLTQKFSLFSTLNAKVFPLKCFAVGNSAEVTQGRTTTCDSRIHACRHTVMPTLQISTGDIVHIRIFA